jgi:hypothetical protein
VYGRARIADRRRIGHCVWRNRLTGTECYKTGKELGRFSKTGRIRPEGLGPEKDSGESCRRDHRMKALLRDLQNSENPKK